MQIIHNTDAVFDVTVNPFLREIHIIHIPTDIEYIWEYDDIDEWASHSFEGKTYDFHLLYEWGDTFQFSIYEWDGKPKTVLNLHIKF